MSAIAIDVQPTGWRPARSRAVGEGADELGADEFAARGSVRLTRAGRLAVTVTTLLGLVLAGASIFAGSVGASSPPARVITIRSGQTLSELAVTYLPELSMAEGVAEIQAANHLQNDRIIAGERLLIPRR